MAFQDDVKKYGSVSAALSAKGYTKDSDGTWKKSSTSDGSGSSAAKTTSGTAKSSSTGSYAGTNYHQDAIDAAKAGDWNAVSAALSARDEKITAQGGNDRGTTSADIYKSLLAQYGGSGVSSAGGSTSSYTGTNYHQDAIDAAARGDWDAVRTALNLRDQKVAAQGGDNRGLTSADIYSSLLAQYGGPATAVSDYPTFDEYLDSSGYNAYADQVQSAIQASVDQAVNGYQGQIDTTNQESAELARQAYVAKMLAEKNLGQQLSANGYSGGMADSQRISMESNYQNQLTDIEKQRLQTVKELETAITNAQLAGDMQTAQELSAMLQNIQSQWTSYVQNQKQLDASNYWNQMQLNNQNYWNQQNQTAQNTESAYTRAINLISQGFMPDDETLAAAGITRTAAQQRLDQLLGQSGGTEAQAVYQGLGGTAGGSYNNGSLTTSQVQQLQQALGVKADGLWGRESQKAANGLTADQAWAQLAVASGTFSPAAYAFYLSKGDGDRADSYLEKYWAGLSQDQVDQVKKLYATYTGT